MLTLLELGKRQCRYPITDDPPHYFCGEATDGRSYCPAHDKMCHGGKGKDWQALAGMMANVEQTIVSSGSTTMSGNRDKRNGWRRNSDLAQPIDKVLAEAADHFDAPGGLMRRT